MAETILILGGGIMQTPAIGIARRRGWRVLLADGNPDCVARPLADAFYHVDLVDHEALAALAVEHARRGGLQGVFTAGTDFSLAVAIVAQRCGLPGIAPAAAAAASDKLLMRRTLASAGVPQPRFTGVEGGRGGSFDARLALPLVVKPVDNMGARGVRLVEREEDLAAGLEAALAASRSRRAIVEQYMSGPELSLDAIVHRGRVTICGVADRHLAFAPHFVEMGHTMPSALGRGALDEAVAVFARAIAALGIDNGAAKGDIKVTPQGAMVGEVAARLSGGYMSGWTFPYSSGVEVTEAAMEIAMGLEPGDLTPKLSMVSAERAFVSIPGRVTAVEGVAAAGAAPAVRDIFVRVRPGDQVALPTNNVQKCGNVISQAVSRETAVAAAESAAAAVFLRLAPGEPATEAFLSEPGGPAAFALRDPANRRALEAMPDVAPGPGVLGVLPLPEPEREAARDWHGARFAESLQRALEAAGVRLRAEGGPLLGKRFWAAFLKGGAQGAVWAVETFRLREGGRL